MPVSLCPICRRRTAERFKPFCSQRCADIDLGRWLTEAYRIPAEPADAPADAEEREA